MKNIYICAKKPVIPVIEVNNEVDEHDLIIVVPTIVFYQFEYQKNLSFKNVPYYNLKPKYREQPTYSQEYIFYKKIDGKYQTVDYSSLSFNEYKNVYFYGYHYTYIRTIHLYRDLLKKIKNKNLYSFQTLNNKEIPKKISKADILESINFYKNKDFLYYNYNTNSLMLFNKILKKLNINVDVPLSINYVQILINMEKKGELDVKEIHQYGSPTSTLPILDLLVSNDFIRRENTTYFLSENGLKFLSYIPSSFKDPNLIDRAKKDIENLKFNSFKQKYSLYLNKKFSKLKRALNKKL